MNLIAGVTGQRRFAQAVMAELVRRDPGIAPRYDRNEFAVEWGDPPARLYLENTYWEWQRLPESERPHAVAGLVGLAFDSEIELSWEEAAPRLLPAVHNRLVLLADPVTSGARDPLLGAAWRAICGDLAAVVSLASKTSITLANHKTLRRWNVSLGDAMDQAMHNLMTISTSKFERHADGFYVSAYEDHYDASRILIPPLFQALPLKGSPIAVAVSRRGVVCAGAADDAALARMADYVEAAMRQETRPISCRPIHLNAGQWWELNRETEPAAILNRLYRIQDEIDREVEMAAAHL